VRLNAARGPATVESREAQSFRTWLQTAWATRAELRRFEESGRPIREKYDWLWDTQLKRYGARLAARALC